MDKVVRKRLEKVEELVLPAEKEGIFVSESWQKDGDFKTMGTKFHSL